MSEFSVSLAKLAEEANLTIAYTPCELDKIQVTATEVYRPGILLALAAPLLDRPWPRAVGAQLAKISYAVFLVHHVLIQELAAHFDLAVLSRRDTAFLFVVYLAATFAAAHALLWLQRTLRTGLAALCPPI